MTRQNEREISLVDLFFYILLRWRRMIVWMVVGAAFFGGYSYYDSLQTVKQQEKMVTSRMDREVELEELENILTTEQLNNVNRVLQYEAFDEYYNQSELMKINPAEVANSKLLYMVKSDSLDESKNIRQIYEELITGGFLQWLEENTTEDVHFGVSELIIVNERDEGIVSGMVCTNQKDGTPLEISVSHFSQDTCKKLSSYLKEYIEEQAVAQKDKLNAHELVYISESFEIIADGELLKEQMSILRNIESAHKAMNAIKDTFSSSESRYYQLMSTDENTNIETTEIIIESPSISVKYVVLGMVVFAFLYVFFLFMVYIMNTKIRISDDMTVLFGVAQLGMITKPLQKRKLFGKIDLWIYKLQNRRKRIFSEDEEIGLTISAIKIAAKKSGFTDVLCIGTAWSEKAFDIAEKVRVALAQEGINVQLVRNVLYDQESLELLDGATGAFLLECVDATFYDEVQKELELLERQEIKCLGIVVAEV